FQPDFVCVTGDLAFSGRKEEYDEAGAFLSRLGENLELDPRSRFFLVPGNHDVDRKATRLTAGLREEIDAENAGGFLADASTWTTFAQRQKEFLAFTRSFLGEDRAWKAEQPWRTEVIEIDGVRVAILCLNSAWACQDDHDHEEIMLGEYQIRHALARADEQAADLKIALFHHPFEDLKVFDRSRSRAVLLAPNGAQFLLRGHLHETALAGGFTPSAEAFEFAAGACWQDAKWPHSVLCVQIDPENGTGTVHAWTYSPRDGGFWSPDTRNYQGMKGGTWDFKLPESWAIHVGPPMEAAAGPLIPEPYRRFLTRTCGFLEPLLQAKQPLVFRLQDVYVPLDTDWIEPEKKNRGKAGELSGATVSGEESASARRPLA
ncbi:MAG: metallophosphoesterase, partial [Verrucomicrobiota bacterium]